jgi:hypothetical protein
LFWCSIEHRELWMDIHQCIINSWKENRRIHGIQTRKDLLRALSRGTRRWRRL